MPKTQMLINYIPGEECRVAIAEDGKLEELYSESTATASRVGNIYVGVVANVEPAIQAAFVDFGVGQHGFLHVTDLHPRYFPGEDDETTERVGHKTPRRERPPLQKSLKRGQEILVQVLKEGVGTKGPSLTTYLSIPGRYLVMMPQMDRVGVSRKVEDEDLRRRMREVLDQLELPESFGFIVRTAGLDRNKTELKRDLAYLQRLWKDMDQRLNKGKGPRLLYTESDLLLRALRDLVGPETNEVVIDNEQALARAGRFLKIVAPRSQVKLMHYRGKPPIFYTYGIEDQILKIHSREVPLPSGGRLVIDQTEALVAIDVNSGKSRSARDAETNAFRTNLEAVDEICRQLKLRDLGGVIIHDLIDMREARHRREIEGRFRDRLKRDRAKSTILPISGFGILEMTRQRMRSSHESVHFTECHTCRGRGLVQRPDSVSADALRSAAVLLDHERIARVEMVVSPRVAGELLSGRRQSLIRLERLSGKKVDVRVSETLPADRVNFYAYDEAGADVDVERLGTPAREPEAEPWEGSAEHWAVDPQEEADAARRESLAEEEKAEQEVHPLEKDLEDEQAEAAEPGKKKRRRRRRRKGGKDEQAPAEAAQAGADQTDADQVGAAADGGPEGPGEGGQPGDVQEGGSEDGAPGGRKKRRRRRRKRSGQSREGAEAAAGAPDGEQGSGDEDAQRRAEPAAGGSGDGAGSGPDSEGAETTDGKPKRKRSRRRRKPSAQAASAEGSDAGSADGSADQAEPTTESEPPAKKSPTKKAGGKTRRRRSGQGEQKAAEESGAAPAPASGANSKARADGKPEPRRLYGFHRKLKPSERGQTAEE